MVPEGVGEGRVDQVPHHQALVPHLHQQLLAALVRFARAGRRLEAKAWITAAGVAVVQGDEVGEEGEKIVVFLGLGRGGGDGLERGLLGFLPHTSQFKGDPLRFALFTYPNVSSSFCTDQISFVKNEVCMVEDDHGERRPRVT